MLDLKRVPQTKFVIDTIPIASSFLRNLEISCVDEFRNNPLNHPFCNPHGIRNVPQSLIWLAIQTKQHMRMICQKSPIPRRLRGYDR